MQRIKDYNLNDKIPTDGEKLIGKYKMLNEMLDRIIDAIEKGGPYRIKVIDVSFITSFIKKAYEIYKEDKWVKTLFNFNDAEDEVERLNNEYVARAVVETMRQATDAQRNNYYEMCLAEGYNKNATSACFNDGTWERSIDAILK